MQIKFCGAARNVTGSNHLITLDNGYRILLDCGLFQGNRETDTESNSKFHYDPATIDCLILSHAHIDHTGRVPMLVRQGYSGCIHSTHATRSLCGIMLLDSAKIQERDAQWNNKKELKKKAKRKKKGKSYKAELREPLYEPQDVVETMKLFNGYSYHRWHKIAPDVEVMFRDEGHILGSANVTLRITEGSKQRTIGFTGDIGRPDRPILRDPEQLPEVDYLIMESTYGDKEHEDKPSQSGMFLNILKETCIDQGGKLIIPAFSIGRTQELVYMMDQMYTNGLLPKKVPIYVDSPLAVNATEIYGSHPECFDNALHEYMLQDDNPFGFNSLEYVRAVEKSKELNASKEPMVIISASGMMNAGRIRHHMFHNLEDEKSTFLMVGYCSPQTAGGILKAGVPKLKVNGTVLNVKAKIASMDSFSAHGDRKEMLNNIQNQIGHAKQTFLVHGEYDTQQQFHEYLGKAGLKNVTIPEEGREINL
ncbi:MAG: metallo-beta-lactamase family protein [Saprospiraceae bacterium]|jgi:metallo-beta-lactamase family protein